MRLCLGLLNEDLADRFCFYSNIFKTWIRVLIKTVGKLEVWFLKESVMETCRKDFKTVGQGKLR